MSEMQSMAAPTTPKTFDDIADEQGWNDASRLAVLLSFIEANAYHEPLAGHAQTVADTENGYDGVGV